MGIRINYIELKNQATIQIGEIEFFDSYKTPKPAFPYFYLDQKNIVISANNWPDLVPILYDKKISIVDENKNKIDDFNIQSISNATGIATLNFTDENAVKILKALLEDKENYYNDNNSYNGWNKTVTILNNIIINNVTYLINNITYYINEIVINQNETAYMTITSNVGNVLSATNLNNVKCEFGIFRIPGESANESVYYTMTKGRFLCNNDSNVFISGLKIKSQIIGHSHDHRHNLNNHTHTMVHTHSLNNHVHNMLHNHSYVDSRSVIGTITTNNAYIKTLNGGTTIADIYSETGQSINFSSIPNVNITSSQSNIETDSISQNTSSSIENETIDDDGKNNSDKDINLKISNEISPESYTVYAYFYGGTYNS